jgi:hypothetical protein
MSKTTFGVLSKIVVIEKIQGCHLQQLHPFNQTHRGDRWMNQVAPKDQDQLKLLPLFQLLLKLRLSYILKFLVWWAINQVKLRRNLHQLSGEIQSFSVAQPMLIITLRLQLSIRAGLKLVKT